MKTPSPHEPPAPSTSVLTWGVERRLLLAFVLSLLLWGMVAMVTL